MATQNLVSASITPEAKDAILESLAECHKVAALDVYAAVQLKRDKIPGLGGVADNLGTYFKRSPKAAAKTAQ